MNLHLYNFTPVANSACCAVPLCSRYTVELTLERTFWCVYFCLI